MKHYLYLFVTLIMITLTTSAQNQNVEIDGIYYNLITKARQAEVTKGSSQYQGNIIIPEKVKYEGVDYSVTSIGENAFDHSEGLLSISIPSSVTSIGVRAFYYCSKLPSITIPNSVISIGSEAFSGCQ